MDLVVNLSLPTQLHRCDLEPKARRAHPVAATAAARRLQAGTQCSKRPTILWLTDLLSTLIPAVIPTDHPKSGGRKQASCIGVESRTQPSPTRDSGYNIPRHTGQTGLGVRDTLPLRPTKSSLDVYNLPATICLKIATCCTASSLRLAMTSTLLRRL